MVTGENTSLQVQTRHRKCPCCGYDLFGNQTGFCPECGEDLNNPSRPKGNPIILLVVLGIILSSMIVMFPLVWYLNRYLRDLGL